ncbi:hypothetical protein ASPWEDRAFT_166867 [Aspergillus wentii DTO 134E9]|uniref:Uncharacterized protein n=1 Tax=Aspergillus wentii DTO 134E9 TaxID=1073089 RepID=A0A1L9S0V8_ASPWE|nr:uncharacterized protein ASPWEDRAFT_166867 [Aspergillus wentii DTO 134E9]KAI9931185.1 hypothetical protein MW887_010844 [Aspergillus wentii]OJJ40807.1 hypothetical protein ASPWEDRAFT_166867 [Aspergillus wentii DTO 134E9]
MGYDQWVTITLYNNMQSSTLSIRNAKTSWGKFHKNKNKDAEISLQDINQITLEPGHSVIINACGRANASSGTSGSIELYDGSVKIGKIYWTCPWLTHVNDFGLSERDGHYRVHVGAWRIGGGAIGPVTVHVEKMCQTQFHLT